MWWVSTQLLKTPVGIQRMQGRVVLQLPRTEEYAHFAQIQISYWICLFIIYKFHLWRHLYSKSTCLFFLLSLMAVAFLLSPMAVSFSFMSVCLQETRPSIRKSESWRGIWQHSPVLLKVNWQHTAYYSYYSYSLLLAFPTILYSSLDCILEWSLHRTCIKICLTVQRSRKIAVGKSIFRW